MDNKSNQMKTLHAIFTTMTKVMGDINPQCVWLWSHVAWEIDIFSLESWIEEPIIGDF